MYRIIKVFIKALMMLVGSFVIGMCFNLTFMQALAVGLIISAAWVFAYTLFFLFYPKQ